VDCQARWLAAARLSLIVWLGRTENGQGRDAASHYFA
jgi:hypothetical protein